jgi:DNA-binding MarR family transcriptional regulator
MDRKKQLAEQFCSRLWDSFFTSLRGTELLTPCEKRVLEKLWLLGTIKTSTCDAYPGHAEFARSLKLSEHRVKLALKKLEMKGFVKAVRHRRGEVVYLLNPLLLEAAYDRTKRDYPDLLAS